MDTRQSVFRRAVLQAWLDREDRSLAWVARQIRASRHYLSDVMLGKRGFTDLLVQRLREAIGVDCDAQTPTDDTDTHVEPATSELVEASS